MYSFNTNEENDIGRQCTCSHNSAFRLSNNLMKPYPFNVDGGETQKNFNYVLSKSRRLVENAFGHLKARFRRIGKGIDNTVEHSLLIINACCVLHNFLNNNNDEINIQWMHYLQRIDGNRQHPEQQTMHNIHDNNAEEIRSAIASFICEYFIFKYIFILHNH